MKGREGTVRRWLVGVLAAAALVGVGPGTSGSEEMLPGRVMVMSRYPFDETVARLKQAIEGQNLMVVLVADHQMMLSMVGMQTKGMLGIEFFHPRYGKTIVENDHAAGIEIPLRLVVMEGDMGTMVSYYRPSYVFGKYPKLKALGEELDGVLKKIEAAVTK